MNKGASHANLFAPQGYINASPLLRSRVVNGCGTDGWKGQLVPEKIWGLPVTAACNIHDWMYSAGFDIADKREADRAFLNNMLRLIDAAGGIGLLRWLRRKRALKYYQAVAEFGGAAFWDSKNEIINTISAVKALEISNEESI